MTRLRERLARLRSIDSWLALVGVAFALPTLAYPMGHDQALFFYVGREWALRGALPYRDAFEVKPPFIYALHTLLVWVTGENAWALRAADVLAVVGVGACAAWVAIPRGERSARGTFGASILAASVLYFGWSTFEDAANCEVWCVLFALASLAAARRSAHAVAGSAWAGAWIALAMLAKPPAIAFAPWSVVAVARRAGLRGLGAFVAGAAAPFAIVLVYFAARHGLAELFDVEWGFVLHYKRVDHDPLTWRVIARQSLGRIDWFSPWSYVALVSCAAGLVVGGRRGDRALAFDFALPIGLALSAWAAILMQQSFAIYFFGLALAPWSVFVATAWQRVSAARPQRTNALGAIAAVALIVSALAMTPRDVYVDRARRVAEWILRRESRDWLLAGFWSPETSLDLVDSARVGDWIDRNGSPGDTLLVRGNEAQVYAFARRRYTGRFFWSVALTHPGRAYRRDEWLAEDLAEIERRPPRWVVALREAAVPEIDSVAFFAARGWQERAEFGPFVVMERR